MAKLGKAIIETQGSFSNSDLMSQIVAYRKVVASNYVLTGPSDIERKLGIPLLVSTKLDGELWFLLHDSEWKLVSPTGRIISGEIEIIKAAAALDKNSIFAGELHVLGEGRTRIADVTSTLSGGEKANTSTLALGIFDVVSSPEVSAIGTPYSVRYEVISKVESAKNLFPISSVSTSSSNEVADIFERDVAAAGNEGLVGRAQDGRSYKIKPTKDIDAAILGFTERRDADGSLMVRSLLFGVLKDDGSWIPITTTGNVGDNAFRKDLLLQLKPLVKASSYRRISKSSGVMYQLVEPMMIVELKCMDLQLEDFQGRPIKHPRISYGANGWQVSGWTNSAAVHNSVVVRLRNDKACTVEDIGWTQITRLLPIAEQSEETKLGASEVIRRQVWTKEGAGKVDVRKLVLWKTNKESAGYPAFVVHWTDFSSTRKSPLDREVRLAPNEKEALKIAELMITENIKKGWNEVAK
ncbi:MAG: hypothetical protein D4R50_02215 [Actinomycetales bacterium]|nr:MAG: hypothetical protein D4R50_02215 [Actinomycetales bacterium]